MLRSTRSMSMTAQGVPYSRAILAARRVVISSLVLSLNRRMGRAKRNPSSSITRMMMGIAEFIIGAGRKPDPLAQPILRGFLRRLFDLFPQHFKLQPAVFGGSKLGLH